MAIYHFSAQVISRGKGQSAVAAAAYRSGERLQDERTGEEKFYHREVLPETMILAPSQSPEWVTDRERLWNEVEKIEVRKNSQLAREINVALPIELSTDRQKELIQEFVQTEFVDKGMVADVCIHRDDSNNPHAHVMLTTREISLEGFTTKNREWNDRALLTQWREAWSNHANQALEKDGNPERISHLSHEVRGLEQLPTVHLGHVVHEMEARGVETERGALNRERQEYNRLVVDLQKYREEKKSIEQELARKQEAQSKVVPTDRQRELISDFHETLIKRIEEKLIEQEQTPQNESQGDFNTPEERVQLQAARMYLKAEPSLETIQKRHQQLDKWDKRVSEGDQYIRWKDQTLKDAAHQYEAITRTQQTIDEQQQRLESINWLNPLKLKENRISKEQIDKTILASEQKMAMYREKLHYPSEKLKFTSEREFREIQVAHETERTGLLEQNKKQRHEITKERDALQNAETALKDGVVREVAADYPEHPDMRYMSFKTALQLKRINDNARETVSPERLQKSRNFNKNKMQEFNKELRFVGTEKVRLERTEVYLKEAGKYQAVVEKYDKKLFVSKSGKKEYAEAASKRDHNLDLMKKEGVSGKEDWTKQTQTFEKLEARVPFIQSQVQPISRSLGILDALIQGIEQASYVANRAQQQKQLTKGKRKAKGKFKGNSMERGFEKE